MSDECAHRLYHIDLCAGVGGWQQAFTDDPLWRSVGLDIRPLDGVQVLGDVRALPLDCSPTLLTMTPPCTEFARWMLPWCDEPEPNLSLVEACLAAVDELAPDYWILENSRGLSMYWREARKRVGPYYLWGEFPAFDVDPSGLKRKMQTSGQRPEERAAIPEALSRALKGAVETYGGVRVAV